MYLKEPRYLLSGAVLLALLAGGICFLRTLRPTPPVLEGDFPRAEGPVTAPVQIIEYSDFECPACRVAQTAVFSLFGKFPGKIRLVYQHFPLEGHRWSRLAHQAAECASRQKKFWLYHDRLYAEQGEWGKSGAPPIDTFVKYAKEVNLDLDRFAACLADPEVAKKISEERNTGSDLGVRSTPSFFVNGKLVVGVQGIEEAIQKELSP